MIIKLDNFFSLLKKILVKLVKLQKKTRFEKKKKFIYYIYYDLIQFFLF